MLWASRPLEPYTGPACWAKHGYRVHTDMIRFWWRPSPVKGQVNQLEKSAQRKAARSAYEYLMASDQSSYNRFVTMHENFLRKNEAVLSGGPDDMKLQLPRRVLE